MTIELIIYPLLIIAAAAVLYAIYKLIWYVIKMTALKITFKRIADKGVRVEPRRNFLNILFGEKGKVDYEIKTSTQRFEIYVLSFVSTHGRWNFEKVREGYYIESRRASSLFYKRHVNSALPDHAEQYKKESRIKRERLCVTENDTEAEKVFLLYPYPKCVTHTDSHYTELFVGDSVAGHKIMSIESLKRAIFKK